MGFHYRELKQMHLGRTTAFVAGLLLVACAPQHETTQTDVAPVAAPSLSANCPSQDFDAFLAAFMRDVEIQKAFTADPLRSDSIDAQADPEPRPVTTMLSTSQVAYPLIPGPEQQARDGLVLSSARSGNEMTVTLVKPDSDYQVLYYFKHDACWTLYRKSDESL